MAKIEFRKGSLQLQKPFKTEGGAVLPRLSLTYHTVGKLNNERDNVVWVCHALTANSNPVDWWADLFEEGEIFDSRTQFLICVNIPGSCYGSSGPLDSDPQGKPYYHSFPVLTIRDIVNSFRLLKEHLRINRIDLLIGASMGGQQALEWAITAPNEIYRLVLLATNARHSAWGIAFNESQRLAIENDPGWQENKPSAGMEGMKIARTIALLSYRTYTSYGNTQKDTFNFSGLRKAAAYQRYQGKKLSQRFNAFSYYRLSQSMDSHDVGRDRGGILKALAKVTAQTLVISLENDLLFPEREQRLLAQYIPEARLEKISSDYGHDGFLIETDAIKKVLQKFSLKNLQKITI